MEIVPATRKSGIEPDRSLSKTPTSVKKKTSTPSRTTRPKVVDIAKIQAEARAKTAVSENRGQSSDVDAIRRPLLPSLQGTKAGGFLDDRETRGSERTGTSLTASAASSVAPSLPMSTNESPTASSINFKDLSVDSELHPSSMQGAGEARGAAIQSLEDPRFSSFLAAIKQMQETAVAAAEAGGWSLGDSETKEVRATLGATAESPEYAIMRTALLLANQREARRRRRRLVVLASLCALFLFSAVVVWCLPWAVEGVVDSIPT